MLHLAIIIGSTRIGRRAPAIANWFGAEAAKRDGLTIDVVDLAEAQLPEALGQAVNPEGAAIAARLARADAFVIVTPEYNHSFPAPLKSLIDWHNVEWKAKPVGFVSYGGRSGGLRAVEQLRQVFAEMHAVTVRDSVSFHDVWAQFDESGQPLNATSCGRAAQAMLNQLAWWGHALKEARIQQPYEF